MSISNDTPFSIRIFVAHGDPDGLRLVSRSNWNGKAVMFPRSSYPVVRSRDEFQQTGVYLLLGPRPEGDGEMLYVGEGDPIRPRIESHYAKKDFWTKAIFFVAGSNILNKAHIQYLESRLIELAAAAKRVQLDNGNYPGLPTLSEEDQAEIEVFLQIMLDMLPVLGIHAFEEGYSKIEESNNVLLYCKGKGIQATGYDTPKGFIVQSGSQAVVEEVESLKARFPAICELRKQLRESGVLSEKEGVYYFTQDYTFNSPSLASTVILARSSNGRTDWKDAAGRTLKEIQQAQAENIQETDDA